MLGSFKLLRFLSVALKVYALLVLVLMAIGLVGLKFAKDTLPGQPAQAALNILFSGSLVVIVLYSLSEIIRLLLKLEEQSNSSQG